MCLLFGRNSDNRKSHNYKPAHNNKQSGFCCCSYTTRCVATKGELILISGLCLGGALVAPPRQVSRACQKAAALPIRRRRCLRTQEPPKSRQEKQTTEGAHKQRIQKRRKQQLLGEAIRLGNGSARSRPGAPPAPHEPVSCRVHPLGCASAPHRRRTQRRQPRRYRNHFHNNNIMLRTLNPVARQRTSIRLSRYCCQPLSAFEVDVSAQLASHPGRTRAN